MRGEKIGGRWETDKGRHVSSTFAFGLRLVATLPLLSFLTLLILYFQRARNPARSKPCGRRLSVDRGLRRGDSPYARRTSDAILEWEEVAVNLGEAPEKSRGSEILSRAGQEEEDRTDVGAGRGQECQRSKGVKATEDNLRNVFVGYCVVNW